MQHIVSRSWNGTSLRRWPAGLFLLFFVLLPEQVKTARAAEPQKETIPGSLKVLISLEQQSITAPFPARLTLHLHNAGKETLWLYRRVSARPREASQPIEGSTLEVYLAPSGGGSPQALAAPAQGAVFASVGLPHPNLVRIEPADDYEEKTVIRLLPARTTAADRSLWGRYRLSVTYAAQFSNAEAIGRNLSVLLWQGEVTSNTIELELLEPAADSQGSVAGSVITSDGRPARDAVVSLSDQQERAVDQVLSDAEGRYSFTRLPWGLYWVTSRLADPATDSAVFRHLQLTPAEPAGAIKFVMFPQEIYEAKRLLHKPVLFRLTGTAGRPVGGVSLEVTWSNGPVLDNVKGQSSDEGVVALELIPGRNFATLRRRGCPKEEQRVDVAEGGGVDGFKLVFECAKK